MKNKEIWAWHRYVTDLYVLFNILQRILICGNIMPKCTFLGSQEIVAVFRLNFPVFLAMVNKISHLAVKRVI